MTPEQWQEHVKRPDRHIQTVIVFANGMAAACDQFGAQMPEFQGRWSDVESKVRAAAGPGVEWLGADA